jgi:hypothetical protein
MGAKGLHYELNRNQYFVVCHFDPVSGEKSTEGNSNPPVIQAHRSQKN